MTTPFKDLPVRTKVQKVRAAMAEGDSNRKAAKRLGTTRGTIAGIRRDYKIPSKNSASGGRPKAAQSAKKAPLKIASSEATSCKKMIEGRRCPYVPEPDSDYCRLHKKK